jgi:hypothetical protein
LWGPRRVRTAGSFRAFTAGRKPGRAARGRSDPSPWTPRTAHALGQRRPPSEPPPSPPCRTRGRTALRFSRPMCRYCAIRGGSVGLRCLQQQADTQSASLLEVRAVTGLSEGVSEIVSARVPGRRSKAQRPWSKASGARSEEILPISLFPDDRREAPWLSTPSVVEFMSDDSVGSFLQFGSPLR